MAGRRPSRSIAAVLVAVAVVAAGGLPVADAGWSGSAPPTSEPAADGSIVDQLVVDLAAAGIEVYEQPGSSEPMVPATAPMSPMRLLRDQVAGLAGDLDIGGGDLGGLDEWPDWAVNCAAVANVALPPLRPQGNPITWIPSPAAQALIAPTDVDHQLREGGVAEFHYLVTADPPQPGQPTITDYPLIEAVVQRDDLRQLGDEIQGLLQRELANLVPPAGELIAPHLVPLIRPWIDRALGLVEHLRDIRWRVWPGITYADPNPPTTTVAPSTTAPALGCPSPAELTSATGQTFSDVEVLGANPEFGVALECSYPGNSVGITISEPGVPWPTPDELAAGIFAEESDCDPASVGQPVSVPGASRAMVYCRAPGSVGIIASAGQRIAIAFATDDATAIAVAAYMVDLLS